jgi:hypothetical protein
LKETILAVHEARCIREVDPARSADCWNSQRIALDRRGADQTSGFELAIELRQGSEQHGMNERDGQGNQDAARQCNEPEPLQSSATLTI